MSEVIMTQMRLPDCKNTCDAPPTKQTMLADGTVVTERLNPMPCHKKMIDPSGHVCQVSLATGWTIRGLGAHNPYGVQKLQEKLNKGWIPYDVCPLASGQVPTSKGDKACAGSDGKGKFSREKCCKHVEQIITARRTGYTKKQEKFRRKMATSQDKVVDLLWKQAENLAKADPEAKDDGKLFG